MTNLPPSGSTGSETSKSHTQLIVDILISYPAPKKVKKRRASASTTFSGASRHKNYTTARQDSRKQLRDTVDTIPQNKRATAILEAFQVGGYGALGGLSKGPEYSQKAALLLRDCADLMDYLPENQRKNYLVALIKSSPFKDHLKENMSILTRESPLDWALNLALRLPATDKQPFVAEVTDYLLKTSSSLKAFAHATSIVTTTYGDPAQRYKRGLAYRSFTQAGGIAADRWVVKPVVGTGRALKAAASLLIPKKKL